MQLPFQRSPSSQDVSWFLDLHRNGQLDLSPPYQRRSVWTRKDRQFFLDTIFRGFPSPAIFLHKEISDDGKTTYHVVDGKQRLETILAFTSGKLRIASDFGDARLDGKKWNQLEGEPSLRRAFWDYKLPVEMVNLGEAGIINEVFDRLNRNSRKLTRQELRHARFDGWFMRLVEDESKRQDWETIGVTSAARGKRMLDSQAISELLMVVLEHGIHGFDQDALDDHYAKYDDLSPDPDEPESLGAFRTEEQFLDALQGAKTYLLAMIDREAGLVEYTRTFGNLYSLWSVIVLGRSKLGEVPEVVAKYKTFMSKVDEVRKAPDVEALMRTAAQSGLEQAINYWTHLRGASTDLGPRQKRFDILLDVLKANA